MPQSRGGAGGGGRGGVSKGGKGQPFRSYRASWVKATTQEKHHLHHRRRRRPSLSDRINVNVVLFFFRRVGFHSLHFELAGRGRVHHLRTETPQLKRNSFTSSTEVWDHRGLRPQLRVQLTCQSLMRLWKPSSRVLIWHPTAKQHKLREIQICLTAKPFSAFNKTSFQMFKTRAVKRSLTLIRQSVQFWYRTAVFKDPLRHDLRLIKILCFDFNLYLMCFSSPKS